MKLKSVLFLAGVFGSTVQLSARPLPDWRCPKLSVPAPAVCTYAEYSVKDGSSCEARIKLEDSLRRLGIEFEEKDIVCEDLDIDLR